MTGRGVELITITDAKLRFDARSGCAIEASDLGLAPGVWPRTIDVVAAEMPGHTTRFLFAKWTADGAEYRTRDGLAFIDLIND